MSDINKLKPFKIGNRVKCIIGHIENHGKQIADRSEEAVTYIIHTVG